MEPADQQLYTAAQVRQLDRLAIDSGITGYGLMCRAAGVAYAELKARWPDAGCISILCGAGNNAGDGYVIAWLASRDGLNAHIYYLSDPEQLSGDARQAWQDARDAGVQMEAFVSLIHRDTDVVVDAMLGTGLHRNLEDIWLAAVGRINASACPVLCVDIPTGIHADTGCVMGAAVKADVTVTFIGLKRGLLTGDAPEYVGDLVLGKLQVPDPVYEQVHSEQYLFDGTAKPVLGRRSQTAHKGQFGHVLVIGGNIGMAGAPILAATAALRSGAGLVTMATRPGHVAAAVSARPELMVQGLDSVDGLRPLLRRSTVIVIGPGLGQDEWAQAMLSVVLESRQPMVVDADALNLLAAQPACRGNWVLTPHPAEAARLLGVATTEVTQDRFRAVEELQQQYAGVVVLKGAGSLICGSRTAVCRAGNPGMATAGMGDVLSGILAALIAQGVDHESAACHGVWLHAAAADRAAEEAGQTGLIASDLFKTLPEFLP